jgi:ABC-type dipeptide/oligopeptide/nickel transport system permease subunit
MVAQNISINDYREQIPPNGGEFQRVFRVLRHRRLAFYSFIFLMLLIFTAIFAPWISPYNPYQQNLKNIRAEPSWEHPLGTDTIGRDTLSRIIFGARTSLIVGLVAVGSAALFGMTLGVIAGYFGGFILTIIMRTIDALMAIPGILLALTIATLLGRGLTNAIIAIGISMIPPFTRLMCGQTLSIKERDYVKFMKVIGAGPWQIMIKHIIPNSLPHIAVLMTMMVGGAILAVAGLSFLGIGIVPPTAAWGGMVSEGYTWLLVTPRLSIIPGIAIMLTVLSFNMFGDGLRDAFDPRLRGAE